MAALHVVLGHMQPAGRGLDVLGADDGERGRKEWEYVHLCMCLGVCTQA